ncbi:MAG: RNA methyltransferase [Candidatus Sericytochromatia bacterium]|nr:RNA methyltransferase [Candidatus Sericytochromatia bacterium]
MKISSKDNKIIKLAKKLHNRKERKENNLFIIEGEKLIKEAIQEGLKLPYLFSIEENQNNFDNFLEIENYEIPRHFMEFISTTDSPPPYLAISEIIKWSENYLNKSDLIIIVNELQDPGNFGTIIRSAEAAGVGCVYATKGTVDLFNPKVVRASMGSIFRQPVIYLDNLNDFIEKIINDHWQVLLTTPYTENNLNHYNYQGKTAIFIGNEGQGLRQDLLDNYKTIKIPMLGNVESLNTSIAASIVLYEVMRQRDYKKNN